MYKFRGDAAKISNQMFPANDSIVTKIIKEKEWIDTTSKFKLPFNVDFKEKEVIFDTINLYENFGVDPCDYCNSDTVYTQTSTSFNKCWTEKGMIRSISQSKDSLELKYKYLVVRHDSIVKSYKEYERECIFKDLEIDRLERNIDKIESKLERNRKWKFRFMSGFLVLLLIIGVRVWIWVKTKR
jgi:hypothetical protein